jgi:hypothetical protein
MASIRSAHPEAQAVYDISVRALTLAVSDTMCYTGILGKLKLVNRFVVSVC